MDPRKAFCPNMECPARGQAGRGNIVIHSQKEQRYKCRQCGKTFAASRGTAFYRLRTRADLVVLVVTLLAYGCPIQAIVMAFAVDERSVRAWLLRSGLQCERVHQHEVVRPRDLGQVQADELWVKQQGTRVWMALAIQVATRLWLGGAVSSKRDGQLIARLIATIRACARCRPLLVVVDGLSSYVSAIQAAFREPIPTGRPGRPRLRPWDEVCIGQVIKQYAQRRVVAVTRHIVQGSEALVDRLIRQTQERGVLNTAYIERLNATFRARLAALNRRTRALTRQTATLEAGMYLVGTVYNFCTDHDSLRLPGLIGGHKWLPRTPAMAAGITDHRWSVHELLTYPVPPPRWTPPKHRGRHSNELKRLIALWCS